MTEPVSRTEPPLPCGDCGRIACNCPVCQDRGWELTSAGGVCEKCRKDCLTFMLATDPAKPDDFVGYLDPDDPGRVIDSVEVCRKIRTSGWGTVEVFVGVTAESAKPIFMLVDSFSASAVTAVAGALSEKNLEHLKSLRVDSAVSVSFEALNKNRERQGAPSVPGRPQQPQGAATKERR